MNADIIFNGEFTIANVDVKSTSTYTVSFYIDELITPEVATILDHYECDMAFHKHDNTTFVCAPRRTATKIVFK